MAKGDSSGDDRYWQKEGDRTSRNILLTFVTLTIVMAIVVISLGVYTYVSWQELKKRPNLRAQEARFEFQNATDGEVNITVHLSLQNEGRKKAADPKLEWFIMKRNVSEDDIVFKEGNRSLSSLNSGEERDITFKVVLSKGEYRIAYRTYEDDLFTYEGRQDITVTQEDIERGSTGPTDEEDGAGAGAGVPMISTPVILVILVLCAVLRWWIYDEKDR
ncbi:MAG: CARDB domain-containing protein [Candidatus Thermoplasmatota archaeon]